MTDNAGRSSCHRLPRNCARTKIVRSYTIFNTLHALHELQDHQHLTSIPELIGVSNAMILKLQETCICCIYRKTCNHVYLKKVVEDENR